MTARARLAVLPLVIFLVATAAPASQMRIVHAATSGSWTVYHHDDGHTGFDPSIKQTVTSVAPGWVTSAVDAQVYASVLIYNGTLHSI